jgi:hypothetical protein
MKLQTQDVKGNVLALKKSTVSRLNNNQIKDINGGNYIPETCGYVCTDCMSTLTSFAGCIPTRTIDIK